MKVARTLLRRLGLLALLVLLASCGGPGIPLTGVVTDSYTGQPVANASVAIGERTVQTDPQGRYRFDSWSADGQLVARLDGYEDITVDLKTKPELAKAEGEARLDLTLRPNTISGLVIDLYTDQPIAGALVRVSDVLSATTGADGRYLIKGVPEQFKLQVSAADHDEVQAAISRATVQDVALRPNILTGRITDKYTGKPVSGARVSAAGVETTTDADGRYTLRNVPAGATIEIAATDYTSQTLPLPESSTTLDAILRPSFVQGTIVDASTGQPISDAIVLAMPAPGWPVTPTLPFTGTAASVVRSGPDGRYKLDNVPEGAQIQVLMPGYRKAIKPFIEGEFENDIKLEPFEVKAIYITAATATDKNAMRELFDLVDRTELNAVVIDVKLDIVGDVGRIGYKSKLPIVQELGTDIDWIDMAWITAEARSRGIYTIARMPVMRDDVVATSNPEWAVKRAGGGLWADHGGLHWLDPFQHGVWDYNIGLAKEIADFGFDEIQYDYIRFPSDGNVNVMVFSQPLDRREHGSQSMYETITGLLKETHQVLYSSGAFFSIDVFGYATWRDMWEIGQKLEMMAEHTDYICPMVYPSHYSLGELGFDHPDLYPYEIVLDSLQRGAPRIEGRRALFRPWLQAFTASWLPVYAKYDRAMIRKQIQAVDDFGKAKGWALWNAANYYDPSWLNSE